MKGIGNVTDMRESVRLFGAVLFVTQSWSFIEERFVWAVPGLFYISNVWVSSFIRSWNISKLAAPFSTGIAGGELKYECSGPGHGHESRLLWFLDRQEIYRSSVCGPSQFRRLASSIRSYPDESIFGTWRPCR